MDPTRFDGIARLFAGRRLSRRQALRHSGAGFAAAGLAATTRWAPGTTTEAAAQDATPISGAAKGENDLAFMFVQSFKSGSLAPGGGSSDTFTLTLDQGLGQTVYFSDRPERVFGVAPTATFLERFPFGATNPPNAALVLEVGPGETDVVVMELTSPAYDQATHTATYGAKLLADYEKLGVTFQEQPKGAGEVPAQFGAASLFIDSCPDGTLNCRLPCNNGDSGCNTLIGSTPIGYCYDWGMVCCKPCSYDWTDECAAAFSGCVDANGMPACDGDVTGGQYSC
jgi:hypothetical protein